MTNLTPSAKGAQRSAENKAKRLKRGAALSRSKTATEVCTELGISQRTLKRYMADPLWQENGGVQLTLTERGRPTRDTLSETELQTLTEAEALQQQGMTLAKVAAEMDLTIDRLKYLRRKTPDKRDTAPLTPADTEKLQQAYHLHDAGMNWKDIPAEIGISPNRLRYLRRKHEEKTESPPKD